MVNVHGLVFVRLCVVNSLRIGNLPWLLLSTKFTWFAELTNLVLMTNMAPLDLDQCLSCVPYSATGTTHCPTRGNVVCDSKHGWGGVHAAPSDWGLTSNLASFEPACNASEHA